jgi:hypothetical protein
MVEIPELPQDLLNKWFRLNVLPKYSVDGHMNPPAGLDTSKKARLAELLSSKICVIGFDIYRYASLALDRQAFVPIVIDEIVNYSIHVMRQSYDYVFQRMDWDRYSELSIGTGDGRYYFVDTPLHGLLHVLMIASILRMYNSYHFLRELRAQVGQITARFAITYDSLYRYKSDVFGTAIVQNARLLSRDRLNRLLIDDHTHDWFMENIGGLEALMTLTLKDLSSINPFLLYDQKKMDGQNALIPKEALVSSREGIKAVDVLKVGEISQKEQTLDVYSVHIQAAILYKHLLMQESALHTLTVGNLNTAGI